MKEANRQTQPLATRSPARARRARASSAKVEVDAVLNKEAAMEDQIKTGIKELEMPQTKDAVMIDSK